MRCHLAATRYLLDCDGEAAGVGRLRRGRADGPCPQHVLACSDLHPATDAERSALRPECSTAVLYVSCQARQLL